LLPPFEIQNKMTWSQYKYWGLGIVILDDSGSSEKDYYVVQSMVAAEVLKLSTLATVLPRSALLMVLVLLIAGPWPVLAETVNYDKVDLVSSGSNAIHYTHVAFNPCTGEALLVGWNGYMTKYTGTSLERVQTNTVEMLQSVAWTPDCTEALAVGQNGTVLLYKNGAVTKLNSGISNLLQDVTWTTDGKAIIAAGTAGVLWWDGTSFKMQALPDQGYEVFGIAWNPKADWGVVVGQKLSIYKFSETSMSKIAAPAAPDPSLSLYKASWRPDGGVVTMVGKNGTIIDYDGVNYPNVVSGGNGIYVTFLDVAWRPNGDFAVIVGDTGTVLCYRKQNDFPYIPTHDVRGLLYGVDWSSNSSLALLVGNTGVVLRYPAKVTPAPPMAFNSAMVAAMGILFVIVAAGIVYLYVADRRERRRQKARLVGRRSKRHGRSSRRRR